MKVIYHCYGGAHSSVVAAALHLGLLDKGRPPSAQELLNLPYYDKTDGNDFGTMHFMGIDKCSNPVYAAGKKNMGEKYSKILMGIAEILGVEEELLLVDCFKRINWSMKLGGFTSRRLNLVYLGRPILNWGTQRAFSSLVDLVEISMVKSFKQ